MAEVPQEEEAVSALAEEAVPEAGVSHEVGAAASLPEAEGVPEEGLLVGVDRWTRCTSYFHCIPAFSASFVWCSSYQGRLLGLR